MKKIILLVLAFSPALATAQVFGKTVFNCTYWTHKDGMYHCASYPQREQLADVNDVNFVIRQLEKRIADLEKKLAEKP